MSDQYTTTFQLLGTTKSVWDKRRRQGTAHTITVGSDSGISASKRQLTDAIQVYYSDTYDPSYDKFVGVLATYANGDSFYYTRTELEYLLDLDLDAYEAYLATALRGDDNVQVSNWVNAPLY